MFFNFFYHVSEVYMRREWNGGTTVNVLISRND